MNDDFWKRFPPIPGFDCMKMKREIQARIYEEIKDMTAAERIAYFNKAGERYRMKDAAHAAMAVREASAGYGKPTKTCETSGDLKALRSAKAEERYAPTQTLGNVRKKRKT